MGLAGFGSISWEGWEQTPPAPHSRIYPPGWSSVKVRGVLWFWGGFGLFWVGFFFFFLMTSQKRLMGNCLEFGQAGRLSGNLLDTAVRKPRRRALGNKKLGMSGEGGNAPLCYGRNSRRCSLLAGGAAGTGVPPSSPSSPPPPGPRREGRRSRQPACTLPHTPKKAKGKSRR